MGSLASPFVLLEDGESMGLEWGVRQAYTRFLVARFPRPCRRCLSSCSGHKLLDREELLVSSPDLLSSRTVESGSSTVLLHFFSSMEIEPSPANASLLDTPSDRCVLPSLAPSPPEPLDPLSPVLPPPEPPDPPDSVSTSHHSPSALNRRIRRIHLLSDAAPSCFEVGSHRRFVGGDWPFPADAPRYPTSPKPLVSFGEDLEMTGPDLGCGLLGPSFSITAGPSSMPNFDDDCRSKSKALLPLMSIPLTIRETKDWREGNWSKSKAKLLVVSIPFPENLSKSKDPLPTVSSRATGSQATFEEIRIFFGGIRILTIG